MQQLFPHGLRTLVLPPLTKSAASNLLAKLLNAVSWLWLAVLLLPLLVLLSSWLNIGSDSWRHVIETLLPELAVNTLMLVCGVIAMCAIPGIGFAWLNSSCDYPGRRWLDWALVLPLAIPAYILSVAFLGFFGLGGTAQQYLSTILGEEFVQKDIRNPIIVMLVLSLSMYPYLYLLMRAAFLTQGKVLFDAARSLGYRPGSAFIKAVLPAARPALVGGCGLIMMETLAEFGAVSIFNYNTLTTGIYHIWFGLFDLAVAAQLASFLLLLVLLAVIAERTSRPKGNYSQQSQHKDVPRLRLTGFKGWLAFAGAFAFFAVAFLIPVAQLGWWSLLSLSELDPLYFELVWHSISLATLITIVTVVTALLLTVTNRWQRSKMSAVRLQLAKLGFAVPGTVLAAGMVTIGGMALHYSSLPLLENSIIGQLLSLLIPGSLLLLILGCAVRFTAPSLEHLENGMGRIHQSVSQAAQSLGASKQKIIFKLYLPMMTPALGSAMLIVFVESMREMPMTLLLRPFGWNTLAVRVFEMSSEGEWQRAALPALTLVLSGLLPVILLLRQRRIAAGNHYI